ncbi:hypothetical protein [Streptomyces sp. NPDC059575]
MSTDRRTDWRWEYDPDHEHVVGGVAPRDPLIIVVRVVPPFDAL